MVKNNNDNSHTEVQSSAVAFKRFSPEEGVKK